jgi:hypothetical protein
MSEMTVQTQDGKLSVTFDYDLPEAYDEAVQKFGKAVTDAFAVRGLTVAIQGHARSLLKSGKSADEIKADMRDWKPGMPRVTKTAEERFDDLWGKMTPEDRAAIQKKLKTQPKAAA